VLKDIKKHFLFKFKEKAIDTKSNQSSINANDISVNSCCEKFQLPKKPNKGKKGKRIKERKENE
jgi:hypothetical protein